MRKVVFILRLNRIFGISMRTNFKNFSYFKWPETERKQYEILCEKDFRGRWDIMII